MTKRKTSAGLDLVYLMRRGDVLQYECLEHDGPISLTPLWRRLIAVLDAAATENGFAQIDSVGKRYTPPGSELPTIVAVYERLYGD